MMTVIRLCGAMLFVWLAGYCVWRVVTGLRGGAIENVAGVWTRREHPVRFWLIVTANAAYAALGSAVLYFFATRGVLF